MTLTTRPFRWPIRAFRARAKSGESPNARVPLSGADLNPPVASIARPVAAASPETRVGELAEMLRMSPYSQVPIVSAANGELLGMVSEAAISNQLLAADDEAARTSARQATASRIMEPPIQGATLFQRARDVSALMEEHNVDVLPVVDHNRRFLGMVSRSDLVSELLRPFRPPTVGGMATPSGVYLTTGQVSGGGDGRVTGRHRSSYVSASAPADGRDIPALPVDDARFPT